MDQNTAKALKRLNSRFILLGGRLRRKGAEALSGTSEPAAAEALVAALGDSNEKVRTAARNSLGTLKAVAVNRFCELWAKARNGDLESILLECGYVASEPPELHVLTLLKNGRGGNLVNVGSSGADILFDLLGDKDSAVAAGAERVLLSIVNEETVNHLCRRWAESRNPVLEGLILRAPYVATAPGELRQLTLLKQGRAQEAVNVGQAGVKSLIYFLRERDPTIALNAKRALCSLPGQEAINQFCEMWDSSRDEALTEILLKGGYVATAPARLSYLTLLKQGRTEEAANADPEGVAALLELRSDRDPRVREKASLALSGLERPEAVSRLCGFWAHYRDTALKEIIVKVGYIASEPLDVHALTSFLSGKEPKGPVPADTLKNCLLDREGVVAKNAVDYIAGAGGNATTNWLLPFLVEKLDLGLFKRLNTAGWYPAEAADRALFYFLAGDLEKYHDIDFEQKHLRYWYETAGPELKAAIAAGIRQSGQRRLLAVFRTERGGRKQRMTVGEVELQIEILTGKQDFAGLFGLLAFATYEQGMRIMQALQAAGWQSPDSHTRELQQRLDDLMKAHGRRPNPSAASKDIVQDFRPMFMGSEKPPGDGPGLSAWLTDPNSFRRRSAALITMAEGNLPGLKEAAGKASADSYWQVRMAAAACELLQPGTLSAENRTLLENDHVYWVRAALKMVKAERLVELDPAGLEKLRLRGDKRDPKEKPESPDDFFELMRGPNADQEKEYLLTLGEFLGTDVVVSDETAYEADVSDIEIEVEK